MNRKLYLIVDNIRSCWNVGSLMRTAEGLGIEEVYLCGYTPYPIKDNDQRLPYVAKKITNKIHKTALGAENKLVWEHYDSTLEIINILKAQGVTIIGLEQSKDSIPIYNFKPPDKIAILVGSELSGIKPELLEVCDLIIEIPMNGIKESYNVSVAAAMTVIVHLGMFPNCSVLSGAFI